MLCAKFGLKWTSGVVEEDGNVNSFGQTERRTIGDQSLRLRWAKKRGAHIKSLCDLYSKQVQINDKIKC